MSIYYNPESFGFRVIGEVEFSSGSYEFDTTVVWQDIETGVLYYADDSGCSCPIPFDDIDRSNVVKVERAQDLIDHFDQRKRDSYWYSDDYYDTHRAEVDGQIGALILKAREAAR